MAGKAIQIIAGGIGVGAVAPFGVGSYTIVQNTNPPFITAGRLAQLADAVQSVTAAGVSGPSTSFVLGPSSDNRGAASTVIIGHTVLQTGAAGQGTKAVYIGGNIDPGAAATSRANNVYIGWDFTLTDGGSSHGSNVFIGQAITTAGGTDCGTSVLIGVGVSMGSGDNVGIGAGVTAAFGESVVIGFQALNSQSQCVAIGKVASSGTNGVAIGRRARADNSSVAIGFFCDALGTDQVHVGRDITGSFTNTVAIGRACVIGANDSIAIGRSASTAVANQCTIGSSTSFITLLLVGGGGVNGTPRTLQFRPSAGTGSDVAGWTLQIVAGWGTGNAATGGIEFQTGIVAASGSTLQTLATRLTILPSAGGAAQPWMRLDNFTNGAAANVGTLNNAPTAGDPAEWFPVNSKGNVRYIPLWA